MDPKKIEAVARAMAAIEGAAWKDCIRLAEVAIKVAEAFDAAQAPANLLAAAASLKEMIEVYGSDDDHGPIPIMDRAKAALAGITAEAFDAAQAPASNGWQPIETAPRDGTHILLLDEVSGWIGSGNVSPVNRSYWGEWDQKGYGAMFPHQPTHWRPLPAPPETDR